MKGSLETPALVSKVHGFVRYTRTRTMIASESEEHMKYTELQDEIKNAMRAKDKPKLSILRQVHG